MRRFFIAMVTVVLMTSAVFLSGCSLGTPDRETELKDTLSDTYSELNSTFSGNTGKYPLVAEYLTSWAKSNDLTVKKNPLSWNALSKLVTSTTLCSRWPFP